MHFNAAVILPSLLTERSGASQIKGAVDKLLFPFSEEFEVKPYIEECYCIVESISLHHKRNKRHGKPDDSCDTCHGTGKMKSTHNKFACFDWSQIGGRWDGQLAPRKRNSPLVWRNCIAVKDLPSDYHFFAVLTPSKHWYEQWQFMKPKRTEKKEIGLWKEFQIKLFRKYRRNLLVLIDCHRV